MDVVREASSKEGLNGLSSPHSGPHSGRIVHDGGQTTAPPRDSENHALPPMPLGFQGMLKTSTETGDIGQFSIKPPRVPHHPAAMPIPMSPRRRIMANTPKFSPERSSERYPTFHPMGDDRRRLPSYNLTPSDTVSLFDTTSQKSTLSSGRPFKDAEYRASSMTTSSYVPLGISSNHHSYTSLRSQPEPISQRPRSPFLYPARLKRPGFRPSSPLLSDGGVDYSRRAEIDRPLVPPVAPYMTNGGSTPPPPSFYAHKRVPPPLSIRTEVNRSNPSPRKPRSPGRNQNWQSPAGNEDSFREWARRKDAADPGDVSPARSNYSYASTVNLYRSGPPGSTTTTPGRFHPPSPLYYDYTEEFETEEYSEPTRDDAPPPFHLVKTIHEDRPLSTGWESLETSEVREAQPRFNAGRSIRSSAGELITEFDAMPKQMPGIDQFLDPSAAPKPLDQNSANLSCAGDSLENLVRMYENENDNEESGGDEAPDRDFPLRTHQMQQDDTPITTDLPSGPVVVNGSSGLLAEFDDLVGDNLTDRSSDYSLSSNLPMNFPRPPMPLPPLPLMVDKITGNGNDNRLHLNKKLPGKPPEGPTISDAYQTIPRAATSADHRGNYGGNRAKHRRSASTQSGHYRSSKVLSVDPGLTDLAQLVSTFEAAKARGEFGWSINGPPQPMRKSSTCTNIQSSSNGQNHRAEQRPLKQHRSESNLSNQGHKAGRHGYQEPHKFTHAALQASTNFSTPMFAPKPISPARVAKLKTTVPQLMKALPALPKQGSLRAISPPTSVPSGAGDLPCRFSPLPRPIPEPVELDPSPVHNNAELPTMPRAPPKLKVRLRKTESAGLPTPSLTPRPWNLDESYPWTGEPVFRLGSGAVNQQQNKVKSPKFKLKVSRPSVSSIETIHIHRTNSESRESLGLENPADLFTPPSRQHGIHALFSKVSRHFSNPKKAGASGKSVSMENVTSGLRMEMRRNTGSSDRGSSLDLGIPQLPLPVRTGEARSFFSDDSSQIQESQSLRKRITNLRARLPTPYSSRPSTMATRSYDDIVYRHHSIGAATGLGRGDFRIENETVSTDRVNTGPESHRHRLKTTVTGWLGRAKNLMTGYMRPRHHKSKDQVNGNVDG